MINDEWDERHWWRKPSFITFNDTKLSISNLRLYSRSGLIHWTTQSRLLGFLHIFKHMLLKYWNEIRNIIGWICSHLYKERVNIGPNKVLTVIWQHYCFPNIGGQSLLWCYHAIQSNYDNYSQPSPPILPFPADPSFCCFPRYKLIVESWQLMWIKLITV